MKCFLVWGACFRWYKMRSLLTQCLDGHCPWGHPAAFQDFRLLFSCQKISYWWWGGGRLRIWPNKISCRYVCNVRIRFYFSIFIFCLLLWPLRKKLRNINIKMKGLTLHNSLSKAYFLPWPPWLSWLSVVLQSKSSSVWFPVRAHAWVAVGSGVGKWGESWLGRLWEAPDRCISHTSVFLSLSFLPPFPSLKINK